MIFLRPWQLRRMRPCEMKKFIGSVGLESKFTRNIWINCKRVPTAYSKRSIYAKRRTVNPYGIAWSNVNLSVTMEDNFGGYLRSQNISKLILLGDLLVEFLFPKQRHSGAGEIRKTFRAMHRSHPKEQLGHPQERTAFASQSMLNKHTSNLRLFANTYYKSSTSKPSHTFLHGCVVKNAWYYRGWGAGRFWRNSSTKM